MGCPWCKDKKTALELTVQFAYDHVPGTDYEIMGRELSVHFDNAGVLYSTSTYRCENCGSHWRFEFTPGNFDPRDSSFGAEWYRITCLKQDT